jgi:hypothetical protein
MRGSAGDSMGSGKLLHRHLYADQSIWGHVPDHFTFLLCESCVDRAVCHSFAVWCPYVIQSGP